ncbi:protein FAR1-RELATED SEQUENCE 5-like [Carya illinoinensis]|uniref:protein FAR1-RELATED SEQUENCE 5-like n=1 Tax=Carya illinoinensis TaxID=32201 RepID=UPI001C71E1CC|nr:protein FAR1-RELATED SEQUENCE 5-like [Carya illinoinensis]
MDGEDTHTSLLEKKGSRNHHSSNTDEKGEGAHHGSSLDIPVAAVSKDEGRSVVVVESLALTDTEMADLNYKGSNKCVVFSSISQGRLQAPLLKILFQARLHQSNSVQGIGNVEEHPSLLPASTSNLPTSDIPQTGTMNLPNYMHGYYGPQCSWTPTFFPYADGNEYTSNIEQNAGYPFQYGMRPPTPIGSTSSATSARVGEETTQNRKETETPSPSSRIDEGSKEDIPNCRETNDGTTGSPQSVEPDGGDIIEEPKSGMKFKSFEDLQSYYKDYAKKCGFGVMTQRSERGEDQSIRYVTLGCARGGKARNRSLNVANPRPTGKTERKAKINALKVEGKMRLTTVHNTHNHGLSPKKSLFFRCNREVSETIKKVLDTNDLAGIRINKSFGSLVVGAGGFENLPFLEKDCRNYIDKARHLRLGAGGAGALQDYFLRMQYKNNGFFALMDLDDDGRLRNVFWADPRSRAAYTYFGDVVTFDTTYLTNRYGMPFAPFVGVNHHEQSILLGAGLISSEDTETFTWLFQTWLKCMDGIAPKAIITDQDRAMKNAIALSIEEFEKCWEGLINTYSLQENAWLQSLYAERGHWIPVFLKEFFWAGMSTTQRSESMNAFFDGYVHAKTNLKEFVDQFDNALRKKIENETSADFHSFSATIPCISRSPIEKKFQELYTNAKFKEVQQQVMGVIDMDPALYKRDGSIKTYLVEDEIHVEEFAKPVTFSVEFNEESCDAKCSCGLFQMRGILCRHILAIFKSNQVKSVPSKYILDRWRKDIRRQYTLIRSSYDVEDQRPDTNRYSGLLNVCYKMITLAAGSIEHTTDAYQKLHAMIELYLQNQQPPSITVTGSNVALHSVETTTNGNEKRVLIPLVVRGKGGPPSLRKASTLEKRVLKVKAKKQKAPSKGKSKQLSREDTRRNLFGTSETPISTDRHVSQDQVVADST